MKTRYLLLSFIFSSCAVVSKKQLYYSRYGESLTLIRRDSTFAYEDVIPNGHWDLYVHSQGNYSIKNDTFYFNHLISNADSLYHNGRKFTYIFPKYVLRKGKGFLLEHNTEDTVILKRNSKF